jgi:hypothetical protein
MANEETGPAWERLEDQLALVRAQEHAQQALVPVAEGRPDRDRREHPRGRGGWSLGHRGGALGAVVVVLEGLQQLFQFQQNWIAYRVTAQALTRERSLCLAGAGPYANAERPVALLAQRVERIVSQESGAWADTQRDTGGGGAGGDPSSDD